MSGKYDYDEYAKNNILRPKSIAVVAKYVKQDNEPEKRVELHLHTKMSAMDGVSEAGDLVARAASWGHKAIAITDHGVAQAFPDAMNAAAKCKKKGQDIKVIYGVEAYYVNDSIPVVSGSAAESLDGEFIVFDIETTGLSARQGADYRNRRGAHEERRGAGQLRHLRQSRHAHPGQDHRADPGSTDEMVKDAPGEKEGLQRFYDFCGESTVLVAHNAGFDTGFIKVAAARCGMPYPFTSIDTVPICRALYPHLKNHKLDTVANYLKLPPFNHHRACDDAKVLADIFIHLIKDMKETKGIEAVDGINTLLSGVDLKKVKPIT